VNNLVRDSRTYLAGLGTSAILMLGAVVVLITVSTLFAFSGWGPAASGANVDDLVLEDGRGKSGSGDLAVAAARSAAAAATSPAAGDGTGGGRSGGAARTLASKGQGLAGEGDAPSRDNSVGPAPAPRTSAPSAPAPTTGGDPRASNGLGDTTKGLTEDVGRAVEPLSPALGQAIGDTGGAIGDTGGAIGDTGGALAEDVGSIAPRL